MRDRNQVNKKKEAAVYRAALLESAQLKMIREAEAARRQAALDRYHDPYQGRVVRKRLAE